MSTITEARDDIIQLLYDVWNTNSLTSHIPLHYSDVTADKPTQALNLEEIDAFARITVQHFTGNLASLSAISGTRIYDRSGLVTVQIFTPSDDGMDLADELAQLVLDTYEGSTNTCIWFRNARVNEFGRDGIWFQTNVLIDFTYTQVK